MIDSHCHLDGPKFAQDLDAVLDRATQAGVTRVLSIGTGEIDCAVRLADRYQPVFATVGVHPHDAAEATPKTFDDIRALAANPKVLAFGEIGLDYHYDYSPREVQKDVFIEQLRLARELKLPVIIHTREAWADTVATLRQHWQGPGVMHCFTGDAVQAREAMELGFSLAFGGVLTFNTAAQVREAAAIVPDDRLLIETDAPFLAPIPWRGKRNEPSFIVQTVRKLAEVRGTTPEHIAQITTDNFNRLTAKNAVSATSPSTAPHSPPTP